MRDWIARKYKSIRGKADNVRAQEIERDGNWLMANGEGDLLANALSMPIRIVTVSQKDDQCSIDDMLTFSENGKEQQEWDTIAMKPNEYILIVDLGGHFITAQKVE